MADILGSLIFEVLMWPAEWLSERVWRVHRKEPTWWRVISVVVLSLVTAVIWLAWLVLLIGVPIAIIILVAG